MEREADRDPRKRKRTLLDVALTSNLSLVLGFPSALLCSPWQAFRWGEVTGEAQPWEQKAWKGLWPKVTPLALWGEGVEGGGRGKGAGSVYLADVRRTASSAAAAAIARGDTRSVNTGSVRS